MTFAETSIGKNLPQSNTWLDCEDQLTIMIHRNLRHYVNSSPDNWPPDNWPPDNSSPTTGLLDKLSPIHKFRQLIP